ncbi:E3 ubiquitin-protein ligase TRIM39-like isoform X2 [Pelodiscus sinensis]|uniref:E3 ubiquitin-protein ligase TRIM39-like isoform X2 n=1 Tax=Pelodiscus sinensis TaxID=13735 RepID=UPI003F6C50AE
MASLDPLETLRMDISCSVCLEYLMDPVTIGCGHSFCRACISRCWAPGTQDFLCPMCRELCAQGIMVPSRQLANVVEVAKQLHSAKREAQDEPLCPWHHEGLHFFCKEDQEAVCLVCAVAHGEHAHSVGPLEDAIEEYKSKLRGWQWRLDVKLKEVKKRFSAEENRPKELRALVMSCRQRILGDFEELRALLEEEKEAQLRRLKAEEAEMLVKLKNSMAQLSEQRLALSKLLTDMGEKCLASGPQALQDMQSILQRGGDPGSRDSSPQPGAFREPQDGAFRQCLPAGSPQPPALYRLPLRPRISRLPLRPALLGGRGGQQDPVGPGCLLRVSQPQGRGRHQAGVRLLAGAAVEWEVRGHHYPLHAAAPACQAQAGWGVPGL